MYVCEYVAFDNSLERYTYVYQYMTADQQLIFRHDNTEHHRHVATFPHHKRKGSEANVVVASAPTLADMLSEIELLVRLS